MKALRLALGLTAAAALAGCSSSSCYDNQSAVPLAQIVDRETGKTVSVRGVGIRGLGAPHDSVLVRPTSSLSQVYLPMRSSTDSVAWIFYYGIEEAASPEWNDTLVFRYTSQPYFASNECGAFYQYRIDRFSYTRHVVDSVAVLDSLITNVDIPRISIYFDFDQFSTGEEGGEE